MLYGSAEMGACGINGLAPLTGELSRTEAQRKHTLWQSRNWSVTEGVGSDVCSVSQDDSPLADRSFLIDKNR